MSNRQYLRRFSYKMYNDTDIFRLSKKSLSDFESSLTIKSSLTTVSSKFSSFVEEDNYDELKEEEEKELIINDVKKIRYNSKVMVVLIPCRNDYNDNDKGIIIIITIITITIIIHVDNMWYNHNDYNNFRNCQIKEVTIIMKKKSCNIMDAIKYLYVSNESNDNDYCNSEIEFNNEEIIININNNNNNNNVIEKIDNNDDNDKIINRKKFKVLIIDSSLSTCKDLSKMIERFGHYCDYDTKPGAMFLLDLDEFDIILIDLKNMNIDIASLKRKFNSNIKFIAMTSIGYDDDDDANALMFESFDMLVPRPIDKHKIQNVLKLVSKV